MQRVLSFSASKLLASEMPSCIKSFMLPIAFVLASINDNGTVLQVLSSLFTGDGAKDKMCAFLAKWIEYGPKMTGLAKDYCYAALTQILRLT